MLASLVAIGCRPKLPECEAAHRKVVEMGCDEPLYTTWVCNKREGKSAIAMPAYQEEYTAHCETAETKVSECMAVYEKALPELKEAGTVRVSLDTFVEGGCDMYREMLKEPDRSRPSW